ncbi:hypothetical protein CB0940_08830 [Cercospora beticola]|uniref:Glycosyltransferase family 34 protein n=1 Tax=Cercospora beticola TaxID=122368 RepID=A0A2G5HS74_CERBT|nr:hypothetical protein CB0940_08830 [Cercospora beticola]PIA95082.1 hypothetical protein CB0940_08830 [Cercospora beticola]WPB05418.1 hypothetical protein RHO25_010070 [Cercospora beticola]CAK1365221.1 unnamed protein product [Cercospora beticola]
MSMASSPTSYDYITISNKHRHASKHNYDMVWDFEPNPGYGKSWDKLNITRDTIQRTLVGEKSYEWVWMLDLDTLIMNSSVTLEDFVERSLEYGEREGKKREDIHMILTRDCEPLNAGSMIFRASPWMLQMIEQWRSHDVDADAGEGNRLDQGALKGMLQEDVFSSAQKSVIVPQTWMNSYPEEIQCYDPREEALTRPWEYGDFVIHFAGAAWHHAELHDPVGHFMRKYIKYALQ